MRASVAHPAVVGKMQLPASDRVAPGRCRPRAPTDPYVRTLAHTVPLMLGSPCDVWSHARTAILGRYGDTCFRVRSLGRSSRPRVQHQTPPFGFSFPPPGSAGPVPRLHRYYEGATTSCRPSRRTSLPSLGGTSALHSLFSLPGGRVRRRGLELVTRYLHPGICRGNELDLPSSWGISIARLHMFLDAGRTACTRPYGAAAWPLVIERQRLPRRVFRRSIAWL